MTDNNEDTSAARFRDKIHPRAGEWDFAGFFKRTPDTPQDPNLVLAGSINAIVEGGQRELRIKRARDLVGAFIHAHEGAITEYADMLSSRRNSDKGYTDSPIMGREKYQQFMDEYINVLRGAVADFKKMADADSPNKAAEALKAWTQNPALYHKLDEALCRANDTANKNDLRITDTKLAESIKAACGGLSSSIGVALETLGRQSGKASLR